MKKIRGILFLIIGVIAIGLGIKAFGMSAGRYTGYETYGGDAYTGIQNAAARTANNVQDLLYIQRCGFGSVLLVSGLTLCAVGGCAVFDKGQDGTKASARSANRSAPASGVAETVLKQNPRPVVLASGTISGNQKIPVDQGEILAGRNPECAIIYRDGTNGVSARHCMISWDPEDGRFVVQDRMSSFGTFLENGKQLEANVSYRLKAGDAVYLGDRANLLRFEME